MSRSPEALALGPAVISFRRRYHCPSFGCLLNRSRDCTRSRVPPLSRRRYADPPAGASFSCLRFAPFGLPSLLRKKAELPRKPFSQRIYGVTVAGSGGIDPSRKSRSCPSPGRNEKPDLYAVASCTKGRSYVALPRYRTAAKDIQIHWTGSLCVRVATRRRQSLSRGYDYFFFFEVFFATFLVAALAVFFAFFAFLAMSSSVKNWLSEHAHAVYRHAQH